MSEEGISSQQSQIYEYLKDMTSNARINLDKSKSGGKKKGKKGKQEEPKEEKPIETCAVFVAKEYPDWQKEVITVLQKYFADKEAGNEA